MGGSQSHFVSDPSTLGDRKEWDYIIVGAGPAGCVLAHRLSEDANISVLLIEAGHSNAAEALSRTPACWPRLLRSRADWEYYTTPQPTLNMRSLHWPRGKLLGGSSSINAMMYQHAPPQDIDEWEKLGGTGWNAKTLAPYYRKAEGFTPCLLHPETTHQYRGDQGFWRTGYTRTHVNSDRFVQSCVNAGIPNKHDFNTPEGCIGVSHMISFIDANGQRSSAATAYLPPSVIARPNLTVVLKTYTTSLIFSSDTTNASSDPKCIGVEVASAPSYAPASPSDPPPSAAEKYRLIAKKEIILCAGAINTPQILMCSGIGPDDVLRKAGIPKLAAKNEELGKQVGKNLSDHLSVWVPFRAKESLDYLKHPFKSFHHLVEYLVFGTGPLTTNGGEAAAFIRLDDTRELWGSSASALYGTPVADTTSGPGAPDIELIGSPFSPVCVPAVRGEKSFTIPAVHLRPVSTGTITVNSGNAFQKAICEPNYLDSNIDVHALIRAVRITLKIAHTQPLSDHLVFNDPKTEPNADKASMYWLADQDPGNLTDEEIEEWVRANAQPLFHPTSTCRIADSPSNGVVDPTLRVFGIENLRICDASVFPAQIAAHTTATVIAAAERAADIILNRIPSPSG